MALAACAVFADSDLKPANSTKQIDDQGRAMLIRGLNAEIVFVKHELPQGKKGLTIKDGSLATSDKEIRQLIADNGLAAKPGDRARITDVEFKPHSIYFEVNGGPKKKQKWYQRIQVGGNGGWTPVAPTDPQQINAKGTSIELAFDKYVPDLSVDQVKKMLAPVFNFDAKSATEAFLDTQPPKVKDAILHHQVLVGMNREMVVMALGRSPKRVRERDGNVEYEEWIYGEPPADVQFVRFVGDEVKQLKIMKIDGTKIVRTEREFEPTQPTVAQNEQPQPKPMKRPSLKRPGEEDPNDPTGKMAPPGAAPAPLPPPTGDPSADPNRLPGDQTPH